MFVFDRLSEAFGVFENEQGSFYRLTPFSTVGSQQSVPRKDGLAEWLPGVRIDKNSDG
jgi:hypothetical protein